MKGIEKMRDRESLFMDYCSELRRKEKEEKSYQKEKVCLKISKSKVVGQIKKRVFMTLVPQTLSMQLPRIIIKKCSLKTKQTKLE